MAAKLSMKLLIDRESKKVLFAEAGKDVIDFLFNLLSLPLATVINLLSNSKNGMVGSLSNLYKSVENLDKAYIQPDQNKDTLLKPIPPLAQAHLLLPDTVLSSCNVNVKLYKCTNMGHGSYFVKDPNLTCRWCNTKMSLLDVPDENKAAVGAVETVEGGGGGGFVKDMMTYMVLDDLVIKPMSTISCICLLNQFNVKDIGNLEEEVVCFGMDEGLKMLEASLKGKEVLTIVFV
ncbi:uncharacterized protein LOC124935264 [Impatiens glandulifera]|uniref:uncharacterized protein LOC124935264 n=1 Tax=Impatiens glandulifera TaxID=253017 RepID=UPI001FB10215|nr:uncharacterized protein LOC124935264 [Impatiens glandulifera]